MKTWKDYKNHAKSISKEEKRNIVHIEKTTETYASCFVK